MKHPQYTLLVAACVVLNAPLLQGQAQLYYGLPLVKEAESTKGQVRQQALNQLVQLNGQMADRTAVCQELRIILQRELDKPTDPEKLRMAANALGSLRDGQAIPIFIKNLTVSLPSYFGGMSRGAFSEHYPLADGLAEMGDAGIPALLDECFVNKDPEFHSIAVRVISFCGEDAVRPLIDKVKNEPEGSSKNEFVRRMLTESFGASRVIKSLQSLELRDADPLVVAKAHRFRVSIK